MLHAWESATGKHLWSLRLKESRKGEAQTIGYAEFSADGRLLLTQGDRTTMRLWDTAKRRPLWSADVQGR
jgi:hypothetical protein